jgi:hypothetical protein
MKHTLLATIILSSLLSGCSIPRSTLQSTIQLKPQGRYQSNIFDQSAAEIVAYDKMSKQTFVVNAQSGKIDVVNSEDITDPILNASLNIKNDLLKHLNVEAGAANSVDVKMDY